MNRVLVLWLRSTNIIYRDDDVNRFTDVNLLIKIQDLFDKHGKIHTVTLEMKDLWENRGVWYWLMITPNINVALHGWEHVDYSVMFYDEILNHLHVALSYWEEHSKNYDYEFKPIKVFYPPWNKVSDDLHKACAECRLEVNDCVDISKVYNFHWWECIIKEELDRLEEVLKND